MHHGNGQRDQVIPQPVFLDPVLKLASDLALQVVLGARDPKDLALGQVGEVGEVEASLVEDDDFTRLNIGAKLAGPAVVMFAGGRHDGAARLRGLEIRPDMAFGCGLSATLLGPAQPDAVSCASIFRRPFPLVS